MGVSVVKSWKYAFKGKINLARARASQREYFSVRTHGYKPPATYGHSLSSRLGFIYRPDVSVIQDGFRVFGSQERQQQKAAHTLHEIPSRQRSHYSTSTQMRVPIHFTMSMNSHHLRRQLA
jgi:hypothetical protein